MRPILNRLMNALIFVREQIKLVIKIFNYLIKICLMLRNGLFANFRYLLDHLGVVCVIFEGRSLNWAILCFYQFFLWNFMSVDGNLVVMVLFSNIGVMALDHLVTTLSCVIGVAVGRAPAWEL